MIFTFIEKAALLFSLCFFRMKYEGLENIPAGGGYLVCPNHRSYLDPIFVGCRLPLKRMRFMTKSEIMRRPVFSWILKKLGCFGIERGKSDIAAVETAEALVREGGILMIFPEGTRGHAAQMRPFKSGAAFVAKYTGAGVIPVAVDFTGQLRLFKKVTVRFGKLISNEELGPSLHRASNLIRERIDAMLEAAKWS